MTRPPQDLSLVRTTTTMNPDRMVRTLRPLLVDGHIRTMVEYRVGQFHRQPHHRYLSTASNLADEELYRIYIMTIEKDEL